MTANEFRQYAAKNAVKHGTAMVDCDSIADAEQYVTEFPVDSHDFGTSGRVDVVYGPDVNDRLKAMLKDAGYSFDAERRVWAKPRFTATATHNEKGWASIHVQRDGTNVAWSASESHPAESLGYGR